MKMLLITPDYPRQGDLYNAGFIHKRVLAYKEKNIDVIVFVLRKGAKKETYAHENVEITVGDNKALLEVYRENSSQINKILIHFINRHIIKFLKEINFQKESLIWVHGCEALGWFRRLYDFKFSKDFLKYMVSNTKALIHLHLFIKRHMDKLHFVFVSNWMKKIMETDTFSSIQNYSIIPNVIDTDFFTRNNKSPDLRKNILLIRPFSSKKYANDVAINAIKIASKYDFFSELKFTIIGKGKYFKKLTGQIEHFPNVTLLETFLNHSEIRKKHIESGIFLCPTRQDAQGVSMCEAMASGLAVITSNNSAIPEYVNNQIDGLLTNSPEEVAEKIAQLYKDPKLWNTLSQNAAKSMKQLCSKENVITKEIELMEKI